MKTQTTQRKYGNRMYTVVVNSDGTIPAQPVKVGNSWYILRADEIERTPRFANEQKCAEYIKIETDMILSMFKKLAPKSV